MPEEAPAQEALQALLDDAGRALATARTLDPGTWFEHFVFGVLPRDAALAFVAIHNRHHLRIVRDILAARREG